MSEHGSDQMFGALGPPPLPGRGIEVKRRAHSRLRRAIGGGAWLDELVERLKQHFGEVRANALGRPTLARNLAKNVVRQFAMLYDQAGHVTVDEDVKPDEEVLSTWLDHIADGGIWEMGTRLQRNTLLVNEGLRSVAVVQAGGRPHIQFRNVHADLVFAEELPDNPEQPGLMVEARVRLIGGKRQWAWDVFDTRNPEKPTFTVRDPKKQPVESGDIEAAPDITQAVMKHDQLTGDGYGWRFEDGTPFVPYAIYHRERTGQLWEPWEGIEMIDATLDVAALWTMWLHNVKDASWPQRFTNNVELQGKSIEGEQGQDNVAYVLADPSTVMMFHSKDDNPAQFGNFELGADPEMLEAAISRFEHTTAAQFGLSQDDFVRNSSAESGYALTIKRSAVREQQRRSAPQFARSDQRILSMAAAMTNSDEELVKLIGGEVPEEGYRVTYPSLPMSQDERQAAADKVKTLNDSGVSPSRIWTVQQVEQVDRGQAIALLQQWQDDEEELKAEGLSETEQAVIATMRGQGAPPPPGPPPAEDPNGSSHNSDHEDEPDKPAAR